MVLSPGPQGLVWFLCFPRGGLCCSICLYCCLQRVVSSVAHSFLLKPAPRTTMCYRCVGFPRVVCLFLFLHCCFIVVHGSYDLHAVLWSSAPGPMLPFCSCMCVCVCVQGVSRACQRYLLMVLITFDRCCSNPGGANLCLPLCLNTFDLFCSNPGGKQNGCSSTWLVLLT